MVVDIDYRKFSNRVCNWREASFIAIGFAVALSILVAIILGIWLGTKCSDGQRACNDGYTCLPDWQFCDGVMQCPVGEDEWQCPPSEFYVSFRTKRPFAPDVALNTSSEFSTEKQKFQGLLRTALDANFTTIAANISIDVFRFHGVNPTGKELNTTIGEQGSMAVDSLIRFAPTAADKPPRDGKVLPDVIAEIITTQLRQEEATFYPRGDGVTTGVGVVLRAPESTNCRIKTVYCSNYCPGPKYYLYGSTKGCPECACNKPEE